MAVTGYRALYGRIEPITGSIPLIGELPVINSMSITDPLDNIGEVSLTVPLNYDGVVPKVTNSNTAPILASDIVGGKMFIAIERGGVIVGSGILWNDRKVTDGNELSLRFNDPRSYLDHRNLSNNLFTTDDVRTIIETIVFRAGKYGPSNDNLVIQVLDGPNVGVDATVDFSASELKNAWEAIEDLTGRAGHIHTRYRTVLNENAEFVNYLELVRVESNNAITPKTFELGTNILEMDVSSDAEGVAMRAFGSGTGFGATEADGSETISFTNSAGLQAFPEYHGVYQFTDVRSLDELRAATKWRLGLAKEPADIVTFTVHPNRLPYYGSYPPGSIIRVKADYGLLQLDKDFVVMSTRLSESTGESVVEVECVQLSLFDLV